MGALAALRVAGETTADAQVGEVLSPRQELVHVGLVAGVEDEGVVRRGEDPVQRDRELDHAEIGAEVTAGARHVLHEEVADLCGELHQLIRGQGVQITGS